MVIQNNIKYIYWFAYYNQDSPSVRYRATYPLKHLKEKRKINYSLVIPGYSIYNILHFLKTYFSALFFRKNNSIIIIQRIHSNFIYSTLLKLLVLSNNHKTIYDLDDADYLEFDTSTIYFFARHCEFISAGSEAIKMHLIPYNKNIFLTPSPILDLSLVKKSKNQKFTIGWLGAFAGGHKIGVTQYLFPALKMIDEKINFVLAGIKNEEDKTFVLEYFKEKKNISIEIIDPTDWKNEMEIQNLILKFDLGIATLIDTPVQIAKSGIKAKQYMNNGIPVLSSRLPENTSVVIDGKNGYFCDSVEEMKEKISEFLFMSESDYMSFSKNAKESSSRFNHDAYFNIFNENLKFHQA